MKTHWRVCFALLVHVLPASALASSEQMAQRPGSQPFFVAAETHASLLGSAAERSILAAAYGWGLTGGWRHDRWGALLHVEENLWHAVESRGAPAQGVINFGAGVELRMADDFIRSRLTVGPSILLFDTVLDDAGTLGMFVDLRPAGFRWSLGRSLRLQVDPLTFSVVAPVLGGIPLVQIQYRTVLSVEVAL